MKSALELLFALNIEPGESMRAMRWAGLCLCLLLSAGVSSAGQKSQYESDTTREAGGLMSRAASKAVTLLV